MFVVNELLVAHDICKEDSVGDNSEDEENQFRNQVWAPSPLRGGVQQRQGWRGLCRQASSSQGGPVAATWASDQQPVKIMNWRKCIFLLFYELQWRWFFLGLVMGRTSWLPDQWAQGDQRWAWHTSPCAKNLITLTTWIQNQITAIRKRC